MENIPPMIPYVIIRRVRVGAQTLTKNPPIAINAPTIIIDLDPYLFTKPPTTGPAKQIT